MTEQLPEPGATLADPFDWRATIRDLEYVVGALDQQSADDDVPDPADVAELVVIGQALVGRLIRRGCPAEEVPPC